MKTSNGPLLSTGDNESPVDAKGKVFNSHSLQYLPVGLFGSTVALSGLAIAWKLAAPLVGVPGFISVFIGMFGWFVFVLLLIGYSYKIIVFPDKVKLVGGLFFHGRANQCIASICKAEPAFFY